ncbi:hypothetical protein IKG12_02190 [Candidatus Saccharibacteria bacterium]|nr:hypothetical protein [Candidatus Saccharibacteria bacterium]
MKRLFSYLRDIDAAWLATWSLIFICFLTLEAFFPNFWGVATLKVVGIALCVIYACQKFREDILLIVALSFTFLADIILAVNNVSVFGVIIFCCAQLTHVARLSGMKPKVFITGILMITSVFVTLALIGADSMFAIAGVYGSLLFTNIFLSTKWFITKKSVAANCAMIGFILFFMCDLCVGISYLSVIGTLPPNFQRFANYLAWVFYYPSQVLISNSSNYSKKLRP